MFSRKRPGIVNILQKVSILICIVLIFRVYILPITTTTVNILTSTRSDQPLSVKSIKLPDLSPWDYLLLGWLILVISVNRLPQKQLIEFSMQSAETHENIEEFQDLYAIVINKRSGWQSALDYRLLSLAKEKDTSLEQIKSIFYDYYFRKFPMDQSGSRALYWFKRRIQFLSQNILLISGIVVAIIPIYNWINELTKGNRIAEEKATKEAWDNLAKYAGKSGNLGRQANLEFLAHKDIPLYSLDLENSALPKINLDNADLQFSVFNNAKLVGAKFNKAKLNYASFINTDLRNTKLVDASLIEAELSGANLSSADLSGANLTGANLYQTKLCDTLGLTAQQLQQAKNWSLAQYSESFLQASNLETGNTQLTVCQPPAANNNSASNANNQSQY